MCWYSLRNLQHNQLNWNTRLQKYKDREAFARDFSYTTDTQHFDNDANAYAEHTNYN